MSEGCPPFDFGYSRAPYQDHRIQSFKSRSMPNENQDLVDQHAGHRIDVQPDRHIGWRARELHAAPAYGDPANGAHGTFIKMPAGYESPIHTHTEGYWAVVVSGVMVNGKPGSPDVHLPT